MPQIRSWHMALYKCVLIDSLIAIIVIIIVCSFSLQYTHTHVVMCCMWCGSCFREFVLNRSQSVSSSPSTTTTLGMSSRASRSWCEHACPAVRSPTQRTTTSSAPSRTRSGWNSCSLYCRSLEPSLICLIFRDLPSWCAWRMAGISPLKYAINTVCSSVTKKLMGSGSPISNYWSLSHALSMQRFQ